jgi:signal transduction histidine kinase
MIVAAVWILPAIFAAVGQIGHRRLNGQPLPSLRDLLWSGGDWLVYAIITPAVFWVANRWPVTRPHLTRRMFLHLAFALLLCVAWALLGKILQFSLGWTFARDEVRQQIAASGGHFWRLATVDFLHWVFTTIPFGVIVYICVAGVAHAIRYFVEANERAVQMARLSEQLSSARLSALQARLNPHFLFNTLNTIAVRARDGDGAGTAQMVEQLSDVLRRILARHKSNEVPLQEELDLVRQYLAIEQARFPDRLRPSFDIDAAALNAAVPSFSLQHLVENAVRHGIARRSAAGALRVSAKRHGDVLDLVVTDDGPGFDPAEIPAGHGIEMTRERLRALHGDRASLEIISSAGGPTTAAMKVPYRPLAMEADIAGA